VSTRTEANREAVAVPAGQNHRGIDLPGSANLRDVGGYTADGAGATRWRTLLRAGALDRLGREEWSALAELGVRSVLDLREPIEQQRHPDTVPEGIRLHERPLIEGRIDLTVERDLGELYREILATCGRSFADAVRLLSRENGMPALVHCSAGKDRTGLLVALVLSSVGVADDVVVEDYALTSRYLDQVAREVLKARALADGLKEQALAAMMDAPPELMRAVLGELQADYGGAAGYLQEHGLSRDELTRLREALVRP
jgi:protein-tyrosine phosphatase